MSRRRKFLAVLLGLGAISGISLGIASIAHRHHACHRGAYHAAWGHGCCGAGRCDGRGHYHQGGCRHEGCGAWAGDGAACDHRGPGGADHAIEGSARGGNRAGVAEPGRGDYEGSRGTYRHEGVWGYDRDRPERSHGSDDRGAESTPEENHHGEAPPDLVPAPGGESAESEAAGASGADQGSPPPASAGRPGVGEAAGAGR